MGLLKVIVEAVQKWGSQAPRVFDSAPADGVVGIIPIPNITGEPNREDRRFRRFVAMEPALEAPSNDRGRSTSSVPPLLGRIAFVSLFLGRDGRGWSDEEIARTHIALFRTGEWIEREAIRHGAAVNIELADTYFAAIDPVCDEPVELGMVLEGYSEGLMETQAEVLLVASASRAVAVLGFHDIGDLAANVAGRLGADSIVWFIHPRSTGRSFVVPEKDTGMQGVSLAICYAREDDLPGPLLGSPFADPSTFAHEALHLFGASDKYGVPLSHFPKGSVTGRDMMRLDDERLSRLRIDPATAAEIGWS
jgi:hypothetical protein